MAATLPVAVAKRRAASTFGPMEPGGKLNRPIAAGETLKIALAPDVPQPVKTPSTSVAMMNRSASSSQASSPEHRSLSITASTPTSFRPEPGA